MSRFFFFSPEAFFSGISLEFFLGSSSTFYQETSPPISLEISTGTPSGILLKIPLKISSEVRACIYSNISEKKNNSEIISEFPPEILLWDFSSNLFRNYSIFFF